MFFSVMIPLPINQVPGRWNTIWIPAEARYCSEGHRDRHLERDHIKRAMEHVAECLPDREAIGACVHGGHDDGCEACAMSAQES